MIDLRQDWSALKSAAKACGLGAAASLLLCAPAAAREGAVPAAVEAANPHGIHGLEHTHVITGDIEKSVHFYVDLLGFRQATEITEQSESPAMAELLGLPPEARFRQVVLKMPGTPTYGNHIAGIEIWEISGVPLDTTLSENPTMNLQGKGYNAYRVENLAALIERLTAAGVKFVSRQVFLTPEISGIYALDPDGQIVELDQFPTPPDEL